MQQVQYSKGRPVVMMPGANLSAEEKAKIDNVNFTIEELTPDHVVYILWQGLVKTHNNLLAIIGELVGDGLGAKVAETLAERQAYAQLTSYLKSKGVERGTPELMAEYQDKMHVIRGPGHVSAFGAEFDDKKCVVRRTTCISCEGDPPRPGKYQNDRVRGFFNGYMKADPGLENIEHTSPCPDCEHCEMIWWYKSP